MVLGWTLGGRRRAGRSAILLIATQVAWGCGGAKAPEGQRPVTTQMVRSDDPRVNEEIGNGEQRFRVVGKKAFDEGLRRGDIARPSALNEKSRSADDANAALELAAHETVVEDAPTAETADDSLIVGFPLQLVGQGQIFGGVFTKVSVADNETLGRLKLINLDPVHVRTEIMRDSESSEYYLVLTGCVSKCDELSNSVQLLPIPIIGVSSDGATLYLDVSSLGRSLSLISIVDPDGEYTGLKLKEAKATKVNFADATLLVDVEHVMEPIKAEEGGSGQKPVTLTARWYLKLESALDSAFVARRPTAGLGFFETTRAKDVKINRFGLGSSDGEAPVHYYVKNVPEVFQPDFAAAFDAWNELTEELVGRRLLSYEFVAADDPRYAELVTGDPRFNIVEWDLDNLAPYGGLGPSLASQTTGEIFSANVLVQGPSIVELYTRWFKVNDDARTLRENGDAAAADRLLASVRRELEQRVAAQSAHAPTITVSLGSKLALSVPAAEAALEDPAVKRMDFYEVPRDMTYSAYMKGYWRELVGHELGHNLGLRHNFRGNLNADEEHGGVSASIMEYLSRPYRHKNRIGAYDRMAIAYAYAGVEPERRDMFCTDEDVPSKEHPTLSAECSRDDATRDPYGNLEAILHTAVGHLIGRGSDAAPGWTLEELKTELVAGLGGLASYAASAVEHGETWSNWRLGNLGAERPTVGPEIRDFVIGRIKGELCSDEVLLAPTLKSTAEARARTIENIAALREQTAAISGEFGLGDALACPVE